MHLNRKSLIGNGSSSNHNRVELNFHKNPLNNRLSRITSNRPVDMKPLKFTKITPGINIFKSPLRSPSAGVSPSSSDNGHSDSTGSKVFLEPLNPFSPTKSPNRSIGTRSCVSEFAPVRRFEPEKLPQITPNSFLGDIPRVNLSRDSRVRKPMYGQRNSLRSFNTGSSASTYRSANQSFKFVQMPMSFNFTNQSQEDADTSDRFRSTLSAHSSGMPERPLSRASDVSNVSVNSAISSRMVSMDEEQDEKKRRLLQAIRLKDRRRSEVRETSSMCTSLSRLADELDEQDYCEQKKRKRELESSREDDHEDEHDRRELSGIFTNSVKRRPTQPSTHTQFKNNEILSSYSSLMYPKGSTGKVVNGGSNGVSDSTQTSSVFKIPTITVQTIASTPQKPVISKQLVSPSKLPQSQFDQLNLQSVCTQQIESPSNRLSSSSDDLIDPPDNSQSSQSYGGLFASLSSSFSLFRRKQ
jgi:hypothetical protein